MSFYIFFNENLKNFLKEIFLFETIESYLFWSIFFFLFLYLFFLIKKKKKKKYTVYYDKIKDKKFWLSDIVKLLLYSNQKGKNLYFHIIKSTDFYPFDSDFNLSAPLDFNFLKAIINGYDSEDIIIGVDFMNHVRFFKFKIDENKAHVNKSEIILYMSKNKKDFCIKYSEKEIFSLNPSSAINLTEKFLNENL